MSILVPSGQSWLRVQFLSPANFGSTGGRTTLDRPVALNPWTALPFLPFSSLAGVLAGRFGDVYDDQKRTRLNGRRTRLFGSPDHELPAGMVSAGKPGNLVLGDGELLSFPAPLCGQRVAHVVPLATVAWLARLGFLGDVVPRPSDPSCVYTLLAGMPAGLKADHDASAVPALLASLASLVGQPASALAVAGPDAAKMLWRSASEVRTLTALQSGRKRVRAGSLRTVELLPSGTIFLALVTNQSVGNLDLGSERLQLGAWEAWGCGFASASVLVSAPTPDAVPVSTTQPAADGLPPRDDQLMVEAFKAVARLPETLRPNVRPLLRETGSRLRTQGIAATLAFSLAKAKFSAAKSNPERDAHRWLLGTFFAGSDARTATLDAIGGRRAANHLEDLCHWLSRHAELPPEAAPGGDRGEPE